MTLNRFLLEMCVVWNKFWRDWIPILKTPLTFTEIWNEYNYMILAPKCVYHSSNKTFDFRFPKTVTSKKILIDFFSFWRPNVCYSCPLQKLLKINIIRFLSWFYNQPWSYLQFSILWFWRQNLKKKLLVQFRSISKSHEWNLKK